VVALALDVPCHAGWSAHTFDRKTQKCLWDRTRSHHYTLFYVLVGMLLPFVIIVFCYWRIFVHIRRAKLRILQGRSSNCGCLGAWSTQAAIVKTIRQIKVIFIIFVVRAALSAARSSGVKRHQTLETEVEITASRPAESKIWKCGSSRDQRFGCETELKRLFLRSRQHP